MDCWHEEKNGDLTPRDVGKKSRKYCWFKCDYCNHDFRETIHMVINKIDGVLIVMEENYAIMMIVIYVIIILLLV